MTGLELIQVIKNLQAENSEVVIVARDGTRIDTVQRFGEQLQIRVKRAE